MAVLHLRACQKNWLHSFNICANTLNRNPSDEEDADGVVVLREDQSKLRVLIV